MRKSKKYKDMIKELKKEEAAWSETLCKQEGETAAANFAYASEILLDLIKMGIEEVEEALANKSNKNIPIVNLSGLNYADAIVESLPQQFVDRYNLAFLHDMRDALSVLQRNFHDEKEAVYAHTVMEEILLYLIMEYSDVMMDVYGFSEADDEEGVLNVWAFNVMDDMDVVTWLYCGNYIDENHSYHFNNWMKQQFYVHQ